GGNVHHPEVGRVAAAIVFARPGSGVAGEGELLAVGGIGGPGAPVGGDRLVDAAFDGPFPQRRDAGGGAGSAGRGEENLLDVGAPVDDVVVGAVEGELARLAAGGRNDIDVVVALPVGGEGDPVAVR